MILSGSVSGFTEILVTTGTLGASLFTSRRASCIASAAGCIKLEWNGAETESRMALFAPFSVASFTAALTPFAAPEITSCPPPLSLAISQTPSPRTELQISATMFSSRPIIAAIAPSPTATASCIAFPRILSSRAVSARLKVPAAQRAEYSPRECPATNETLFLRSRPFFSSTLITAIETAINAGCALAVNVKTSSGPSNITDESFSPKASSTSSKTDRASEN